jgi:hypothetical protein
MNRVHGYNYSEKRKKMLLPKGEKTDKSNDE